MKNPLKIGITGGIGSGKSVVCRVLETMGWPVYNSDLHARELMETDPEIKRALIAIFGEEIVAGGKLNRAFLAGRIFEDPGLRSSVNAIVHPVVRKDFRNWAEKQQKALVFQESALLFETGGYKLFDFNVLVTAPVEERIRRIALRDQSGEAAIRARIAAQLTDEEKIPLADFVIENGDEQMILPQINTLLDRVLRSQD